MNHVVILPECTLKKGVSIRPCGSNEQFDGSAVLHYTFVCSLQEGLDGVGGGGRR